MDAEHRHELKQNDFVVYAKKAPQYIKAHWWEAICVVVIIVAVVMMFSGKKQGRPSMEKQAEVTSIYQDIAAAKGDAITGQAGAEEIEPLVRDLLSKGGKLSGAQRAMANIKAADAIRTQLYYSDGMPQQETVDAHVSEAISLYEQAMEHGKGNTDIEAMAQYGIALARQDAGDFDEAANLFGQIIANTAFDKTGFVELAKDKLASLTMVKQQFTFVEPKAVPVVEEEAVSTEENAVN